MKRKHGLFFGFAVLLTAAIFTLAGCGDDDPITKAIEKLLSGSFGEKIFSAYAAGASSGAVQQVEGLLKDGNDIYGLTGFYNTESGNFTLSTGAAEAGFELSGKYEGGSSRSARAVGNTQGGRAKSKQKGSNSEWTVNEQNISFSDQNISGTPNVTAAPALPEAWWGTYDFSTLAYDRNNFAVESWMTGNGGEERGLFVMVLGPYSMDFWANLDLLRPYFENELGYTEAQADEALALYATVQSSFTVLEVSGSGTTYTVLLLLSLYEDSPYYDTFASTSGHDDLVTETAKFGQTVREGYRKIKLVRADGKLTATLAGDSFPYVFKTAANARTAQFSDDDNQIDNIMIFEPWSWE